MTDAVEGVGADEVQAPELEVKPRTALAIFTLLGLFLGLFINVLLLYGPDIYEAFRSESGRTIEKRLERSAESYREEPGRGRAQALSMTFLEAAFVRLDPRPYFESRCGLVFLNGMRLRLALHVLAFVSVILLLCQKLVGRRLLVFCFWSLILLSGLEALVMNRDGHLLMTEYRRDLDIAFQGLASELDLQEQFPSVTTLLDRIELHQMRRLSLAYFVAASAIWQVLLLILVAARPLRRRPKTTAELT